MTEQSQKSVLIELQRDSEGQCFNIPTEFELSVTEVLLTEDDTPFNAEAFEREFAKAQTKSGTKNS